MHVSRSWALGLSPKDTPTAIAPHDFFAGLAVVNGDAASRRSQEVHVVSADCNVVHFIIVFMDGLLNHDCVK
jgi:16S rRNA G966 N2-methylase RsmD